MRLLKRNADNPPDTTVTYVPITTGRETTFEFADWRWVIHADNGGVADVQTIAERTVAPPDRVRLTLGTDVSHTTGDATERVELEGRQTIARHTAYKWTTRLRLSGASPVDYAPSGSIWKGWMVLMQVHQTPDEGEYNGSPPLAVLLRSDDMLVVTTRSDELAVTTASSPITVDRVETPFSKDVWHDVAMTMNFSKGEAAGYLKFVFDGTVLFDATIPLGFNDVKDPYLKFGLYRNQSPGTTVVEFDAPAIIPVDYVP